MAECKGLALVTLSKIKNDQVNEGELARVATIPPYSLVCGCNRFFFYVHHNIQLSDWVGRVENMSCIVLELYLVDVCLNIFNLINSGKALSLNIMRRKQVNTN
jgi:hypothetical protein